MRLYIPTYLVFKTFICGGENDGGLSLVGVGDPHLGAVESEAVGCFDGGGGSGPCVRPIARLRQAETTDPTRRPLRHPLFFLGAVSVIHNRRDIQRIVGT